MVASMTKELEVANNLVPHLRGTFTGFCYSLYFHLVSPDKALEEPFFHRSLILPPPVCCLGRWIAVKIKQHLKRQLLIMKIN